MKTVNLAEAKAHLSELVELASAGDAIQILRRGKPVAQIIAAKKPRQPIDVAMLKRVTDQMPKQDQSAGDFIREMRDNDRY
jgi:prevent-host-death family protein